MSVLPVLSLIIPVYKNQGSLPALLKAIADLNSTLGQHFEAVFVVDGSPDDCYHILQEQLPDQPFDSQLVLLSRNFGSFAAIRCGLGYARGEHYAVMAADLQEPPELILEMHKLLSDDTADVVVGVRDGRDDPLLTSLAARSFWALYRRYVVPDMPPGGVDIFACNRNFRDSLLTLEERHSSLVAQIFWLGFRRSMVRYRRQKREHGKSAWTFQKKLNYLMDSVFAFSDLPIRWLTRIGVIGVALSLCVGAAAVLGRVLGLITVPGYTATMFMITLLGSLNLTGLGLVGVYAWRAYENTKQRPIAVPMRADSFTGKRP